MILVIPTRVKLLEEVDQAKEAQLVEVAVIAVTVAETTRSLNIHLKKNERWSDFQIDNYQNQASSHSIQEDY